MPGGAAANQEGKRLEEMVADVAAKLGLTIKREYKVGRRLWGRIRRIDVILIDEETGKTLGVECKRQVGQGTAEEKLPATIADMNAWPIPGILVFDGKGFSAEIKSYLYSTGKAVAFEDFEDWIRLYFGKHK